MSQKKVGDLEEESGPLRQLAVVVRKFLKEIRKNPVRLPSSIKELLREIAAIVGEKYEIGLGKKEQPGNEIE